MAASDFGHLLDLQHCATVPVDLLHKSVTRTLRWQRNRPILLERWSRRGYHDKTEADCSIYVMIRNHF